MKKYVLLISSTLLIYGCSATEEDNRNLPADILKVANELQYDIEDLEMTEKDNKKEIHFEQHDTTAYVSAKNEVDKFVVTTTNESNITILLSTLGGDEEMIDDISNTFRMSTGDVTYRNSIENYDVDINESGDETDENEIVANMYKK